MFPLCFQGFSYDFFHEVLRLFSGCSDGSCGLGGPGRSLGLVALVGLVGLMGLVTLVALVGLS